ncbi:NADH-quinone oxidoreductase subunit E [Candidatus Providencia siddallii]|uniref:NADH-quinone oxidoreductase subunit E n=1 Tax=Candidatus Providencia siddallii TaxID=1715285 RepID=A0A0M6W7Z4_9GAMM|nr:NADH-quinone oxidoreductase subunit E [Candidatus Providencia siddallii]
MNQQKNSCTILTDIELEEIEKEKHCYENQQAALIGTLKILQKKRGWIEDNIIFAVAKILKIPVSEVEGVSTFYSQIFRKPVGKHIIRYCDSIVCFITGYKNVEFEIINQLKITPGQTTADNRFTLLHICCLGNCDKGPTIMIDDDIYNYVDSHDVKRILELYS